MSFSYELQGYEPFLPGDYGPEQKSQPQDKVFVLTKRPEFHESIRGFLEKEWATRQVSIGGSPLLQYQCGACEQWGDGAFMHLGHKQNWETYLSEKGPLTKEAAVAAYNDVHNLRFEHIVCNVSHLFENVDTGDEKRWLAALRKNSLFRDFSDEEIEDLCLVDIFKRLATRYEDTEVASGRQLDLSSDTTILLADPIVNHSDNTPIVWTDLKRPKWDKSTRAGLYAIWKGNDWVTRGSIDGVDAGEFYRCGSCGHWGEGHSMHIGHIDDWKQHLENCGVQTVAEGQWAYNDLNNLRFEHPTCNMGHEWEGLEGVLGNIETLDVLQKQSSGSDFLAAFDEHLESGHQVLSRFNLICLVALEASEMSEQEFDACCDDTAGLMIPVHGLTKPMTKKEWRDLKSKCGSGADINPDDDQMLTICGMRTTLRHIVELRQGLDESSSDESDVDMDMSGTPLSPTTLTTPASSTGSIPPDAPPSRKRKTEGGAGEGGRSSKKRKVEVVPGGQGGTEAIPDVDVYQVKVDDMLKYIQSYQQEPGN